MDDIDHCRKLSWREMLKTLDRKKKKSKSNVQHDGALQTAHGR